MAKKLFRWILGFFLLWTNIGVVHAGTVAAAMQDDQALIEFTFDKSVSYTAKLAGMSLIIRFADPQTIDLRFLKPSLPQLISDVVQSGDRKSIIIGLNFPVELAHEASGKSIAIALAPSGTPAKVVKLSAPAIVPMESMLAENAGLTIRAAAHPGYYRIVFDWRKKTDYKIQSHDHGFIIIFDRAANLPEGEIKKIRPPGCTVEEPIIASSQTQLTIVCEQPVQNKNFSKDNLVIIDLSPADLPPQAENKPGQSSPKPPSPPVVLDPEVERQSPLPLQRMQRPAAQNADQEAVAAAAAAKPKPESKIDLESANSVVLDVRKSKTELELTFAWQQPVGAVVFKRAGRVWIVFDVPGSDLGLNEDNKKRLASIGEVESWRNEAASGIWLRVPPGIEPRIIQGKTNNWVISLATHTPRPNVGIPVEYQEIDGSIGLMLLVNQPGKTIGIVDTEVGDRLLLGSVQSVSRGLNGQREFAQFSLLPTAQGVVLQPKIDDLELRQLFEGFNIRVADGLLLANQPTIEPRPDDNSFGPSVGQNIIKNLSVLNYAEWRGDPRQSFPTKEREFLAQLVHTESPDRQPKRLELAKLYFAHGWMAESLSVLKFMAQIDPNIIKTSDFLAMRGVAQLLEGGYAAARADLQDLRFDAQADIATWRGVLAVQSNDWSSAAQYFSKAEMPGPDAPPNLRKIAYLARIESEIQNKNLSTAKEILAAAQADAELPDAADILDYWQGELFLAEENPIEAKAIWERVSAREDPYARPRAELALIRQGIADGSLLRQDSIARLERLRFAWRGDRFEFAVLKLLGEMQIQDGLYREGLYNLRRAVTNYADQPYAEDLSKLMVQTFEKLFLEGAIDNMPPITALALFDEFRDLTPTGPAGDKITQKLADRLIGVDLLDRAADLLRHQVTYRLQGDERVRIGNRLAFVYLLDRKPEDALKAIDSSNAAQIPPDLMTERRLLRARALFDLNRPNDALNIIDGIEKREAELLRADIYWRLRNWPQAAQILRQLLVETKDAALNAEREGLDPESAQLVLSLALAYALGGDTEMLQQIKSQYWAKMKETPQFDAFEVITSIDANQPISLSEFGEKLTGVTRLESFMDYYRNQIKKGGFISGGNQPPPKVAP
jgi:hypothetical protein